METKQKLEQIQLLRSDLKAKLEGKEFKTLSTKDKDLLLETIAKMLGLL